MGIFSSLFGGNKRLKNVSREHWQEIITCLSKDTKNIMELFFQGCVEILKESEFSYLVKNCELNGKAEILIKAYQIFYITNLLPRYIHPSKGKEFADLFFSQICVNRDNIQKDIIYDFASKFLQYDEDDGADKRIMLLTQDLGKYILGYENDSKPSSFPNDSDYILSGIPEDKLTYMITSGLLISPLVSKLGDFTALAVANCFGDKEFAEEIQYYINEDY